MNDSHARNAFLAQQARSRMAAKARLPWWYAAVLGLTMLVVLFFWPVSRLSGWSWMASSPLVQLPQWLVVVAALLGFVVSRVQGADFRRTLMAYPSARVSGFLGLGVFVVGELVDMQLAGHGLPVPALVVAALTSVAVPALLGRHYSAVRRDIRAGRVDPRWT